MITNGSRLLLWKFARMYANGLSGHRSIDASCPFLYRNVIDSKPTELDAKPSPVLSSGGTSSSFSPRHSPLLSFAPRIIAFPFAGIVNSPVFSIRADFQILIANDYRSFFFCPENPSGEDCSNNRQQQNKVRFHNASLSREKIGLSITAYYTSNGRN